LSLFKGSDDIILSNLIRKEYFKHLLLIVILF